MKTFIIQYPAIEQIDLSFAGLNCPNDMQNVKVHLNFVHSFDNTVKFNASQII